MIFFLMIINICPYFDSIVNFYLINELNFTASTIAANSTCGLIFLMLSIYCYNEYFINVNPKKLVIVTNLLLWVINLSFVLVVTHKLDSFSGANRFFCLMNSGLYNMLSELSFLPFLTIWCDICPENMEATAVTLFTGLSNLALTIST